MTRAEIEYCVPCGHLDRAVDVQTTLLETFGRRLDCVTLRPGDGGVFEVRVDGETVFDADESGYDPEALTETVRDRIEA